MSPHRDDRPELDPATRDLVARLREGYRRAPLSPNERAAFEGSLRERIERSRRRAGIWPVFGAGLAAAGVAAWLLLRGAAPPAPIEPSGVSDAWAARLLYADPAEEDDTADLAGDGLPPEYEAIASVFLDR
jgi:hypothetical protein